MKPLQLTRILICGLAASTFLLANCAKPSARSVKAQMNNKQGVVQQNIVPCSNKALDLLSQRRDLLVQISQIIAEAGIKEPDAAQKAKLQNQIEELAPLSNSIVAEIKSIKSGTSKVPTGCVQVVSDSDKKIPHSISEIRSMDKDFAKKVQKITKKTNSILEGDTKRDFDREQGAGHNDKDDDKDTNPEQKPDTKKKIEEGREVIIGEELAELLKSASLIKEAIISEGKIDISENAKAMIEKPTQEGLNSFCFIEATTGVFAKEDKLKIAALRTKKQDKVSLVKIAFVGNAEQMAALACRVNAESESEQEVLKIFSDLLKL